MQICVKVDHDPKTYIEKRAWHSNQVPTCPWHSEGNCKFHRHGSYPRKYPEEYPIQRWICTSCRRTVGVIPNFAASHLRGTVDEIEQVVASVELGVQRGCSFTQIARTIRPDIECAGAQRWVRRRVNWSQHLLAVVVGWLPCLLEGAELSLAALRNALNTSRALVVMRERLESKLCRLATPVGLCALGNMGKFGSMHFPQQLGAPNSS